MSFNLNDDIIKVEVKLNYKATGKFIDNKGRLLDFNKEEWTYRRYRDDKINLVDDNNYIDCKVSWTNTTFKMEKPKSYEMFKLNFNNKITFKMFDILDIKDLINIESKVFLYKKSRNSYEELVNSYKDIYNFNKDAYKKIDAEQTGMINEMAFRGDYGSFILQFGVIAPDQIKPFFDLVDDYRPDNNGHFVIINLSIKRTKIEKTNENLNFITNKIESIINDDIIPFLNNIIFKEGN